MWSFKSFSDFLLQGETQPTVLQTCFLASFPHFSKIFIGKLSSCAAGCLPSSSLHSQLQNRILLKRICHWQPRNYFCLENSTFGFLKNQPFCPGFPGQWSTIPAFSHTSVLLGFDSQPSSFQHHIKNSWSPSLASWCVSLFQVLPELEFYWEGENPPVFSLFLSVMVHIPHRQTWPGCCFHERGDNPHASSQPENSEKPLVWIPHTTYDLQFVQ